MSKPPVVRRIARAELRDAMRWNEQKQAGLGAALGAEFDGVLHRIVAQPLMYAVAHGDIRQAVMSRFSYSVFFRLRAGRVIVVGVVHNARDPAVWQGRR